MGPRRMASAVLSASATLVPFAVIVAAEFLARSAAADWSIAERQLMWLAGTRPALSCDGDFCRTDPDLVSLGNPDLRVARRPPPDVFRIIGIGESTTAGWPYQPRGGYPAWLQALLDEALPGTRSEVVNLGVCGWDSERLEPVFEQALSLAPRVVVVHFGYNAYRASRLRRPPGGPLARANRRVWLELFASSALFRRLYRIFHAVDLSTLFQYPERLGDDEVDRLVSEHRKRIAYMAGRARARGVELLVLGYPHAARKRTEWSHYFAYLDRLHAATKTECRVLGVPFEPLAELAGSEHYIGPIHSDLEGYRLTAIAVARALQAVGQPGAGARWLWDRVEPARRLRSRLRLDEPEFRAHVELRTATGLLAMDERASAAEHMAAAVLAAPNPDLIPEEIANDGRSALADLYREQFTRLRAAGRTPDPTQGSHRSLAGLTAP